MSAFAPVGALAYGDLGGTARQVTVAGGVAFAGVLDRIKVSALFTVTGAVSMAGTVANTGLGRALGATLQPVGVAVGRWIRLPLRFARRKGIITGRSFP